MGYCPLPLSLNDFTTEETCDSFGTNEASTSEVTIESMLAAMEAARSMPQPKYDIIVMTTRAFEQLRKQTAANSLTDPLALKGMELYGLPIEHYPSPIECAQRCWKLTERGKRPMFVD